jgi:hypothetical protein
MRYENPFRPLAAQTPDQPDPTSGDAADLEHARQLVDLGDTTRCPLAVECETCSASAVHATLSTVTIDTAVGVLCAALCAECIELEQLPRFGWAAAVGRALEHCGHLGIDADQAEQLHEAANRAER